MIMTMSKSIPKVQVLEMDAGANVLNFPNNAWMGLLIII